MSWLDALPADTLVLVVGSWDESKHPRDEKGRFTDTGAVNLSTKEGFFDAREFRSENNLAGIVYSVLSNGTVFIGALVTNPKAMGQGHGGKLLDDFLAAIDRAGGRRVTLDAIPMGPGGLDQDSLYKFYEKRGFVRKPSGHGMYRDPRSRK